MPITELRPIKESTADFEKVEEEMKILFKRVIYFPLLRTVGDRRERLLNSRDYLLEALLTGKMTFNRGVFSGRLSATLSKELRALGARFDRKTSTYRINQSDLPHDIRSAISSSEVRFQEKIGQIDKKLAQILPDELAAQLKVSKFFDRTLWKTEKDFQASVRGITIAPQLTRAQSKRIADEWETNMQLWVKDFAQSEILRLRAQVKETIFSGDRYGSLIKTIQKSYGVSANKAKFLARQETSLLMTKFKETRYVDAGVKEYKWGCVAGTKAHPVRLRHRELANESNAGKIFTWDNPPITTPSGEPERRNNPGQDYNCRCFARPVVNFRK